MARTNTLGNFLTDVADAIRTKKGSSDTILASDFDTEIENIPTGTPAPTKGVVFNAWDEDGYPTDVTFIGYDEFPYCFCEDPGDTKGFFYHTKKANFVDCTATEFPTQLFWNWVAIKEWILPASVTSLGFQSLGCNKSLKRLVLPNTTTVVSFDWSTFNQTEGIEEVFVPDAMLSAYQSSSWSGMGLKPMSEYTPLPDEEE